MIALPQSTVFVFVYMCIDSIALNLDLMLLTAFGGSWLLIFVLDFWCNMPALGSLGVRRRILKKTPPPPCSPSSSPPGGPGGPALAARVVHMALVGIRVHLSEEKSSPCQEAVQTNLPGSRLFGSRARALLKSGATLVSKPHRIAGHCEVLVEDCGRTK